jgi:hypothetical protein
MLLVITFTKISKSRDLLKLRRLCHTAIRRAAYKAQMVSRSVTTANISAMSELTGSNLPLICGVRAVTCTRSALKIAIQHQYRHAATVGGRSGASSLQLSRLQAHQGRKAKEKVAESTQVDTGKEVLFQPHQPRTILHGSAMQKHTAMTASASLSCMGLPHHSGSNQYPSIEARPTASTKSVSSGS